MSATTELRQAYRDAFASWCYTRGDQDRGLVAGERARHADIEDQAGLAAARWWVMQARPLHPRADPGWPGGWLDRSYLLHGVVCGPTFPHPPVWTSEQDALEGGVDPWALVWAPMCRIGGPAEWLLLDAVFWAQRGDDVLITGPPEAGD